MAKRPVNRANSYTSGQLDTDVRRVMRALVASDESRDAYYADIGYDAFRSGPSDRRLRELAAIRSIRAALDRLADQKIVDARRNDPVLTWREIGAALGMTGQAAGQHAHQRELPVDPVTSADYLRLVDEARHARGLPPLPPDTRPAPSLDKYDELLGQPPNRRSRSSTPPSFQ